MTHTPPPVVPRPTPPVDPADNSATVQIPAVRDNDPARERRSNWVIGFVCALLFLAMGVTQGSIIGGTAIGTVLIIMAVAGLAGALLLTSMLHRVPRLVAILLGVVVAVLLWLVIRNFGWDAETAQKASNAAQNRQGGENGINFWGNTFNLVWLILVCFQGLLSLACLLFTKQRWLVILAGVGLAFFTLPVMVMVATS